VRNWGDELTAEKMKKCVWLLPEAVALGWNSWSGLEPIGFVIPSLWRCVMTRIRERSLRKRRMRDSYVADVGDFGKYALLNALAGNDLRLAVLWCRNSLADATQDGRFTVYPELRRCDPRLYDRLSEILATNQRTLSQVENNDILPTRTLFYGTAIPAPEAPCFSDAAREAQARLRAAWLDEAFKRLL
jgi:hypothetical protein